MKLRLDESEFQLVSQARRAIRRTSPRGLFDVLAALGDEELCFLGWRVRLFLRVCAYGVGGRRWSWDFLKYVITDAWNFGSAPDPFWGSRGDGNVACSLCASATSARTLVHVAQSVPQLRAVPDVLFSQL